MSLVPRQQRHIYFVYQIQLSLTRELSVNLLRSILEQEHQSSTVTMIHIVTKVRLAYSFREKNVVECDVSYENLNLTGKLFFEITMIPKPGSKPFSKTLQVHISRINRYFSFIFSPIFLKLFSVFNKLFQFNNCGISYGLTLNVMK